MKAFCIWCEYGEKESPSGYFWIHPKCANELMEIKSDLETIRKILEGQHKRNENNADRLRAVYDFIMEMEEFDRRWNNSMDLIKAGLGARK